MSSYLTTYGLSAATPDGRTLFHDLTISVGPERVGLVGRNGSGKSTLLRIAAGEIAPSSGTIHRSGSTGMLRQHWSGEETVCEALGVDAALAIHRRIEQGDGTAADFDAADWGLPAAIGTALDDVGLAGIDLQRNMGSLSGGEQTRAGIARLLIERPDLLLLDEPTNNLDLEGRAAIERLIGAWTGGVLLASHDRALLEHMDRIIELSPVAIRIVGGGWTAFKDVRDAERARIEAESVQADAALHAARRAAQDAREAKDRRDKAGRSFAAKGSEPKILLGARARRAENSGGQARRLADRQIDTAARASNAARARLEIHDPLVITIPGTGMPPHAQVLVMEDAAVDLGCRRLGPWTLAIHGPERIAIKGANGTGKSTLLGLATGALAPSTGTVHRRADRIALLDQHVGLLDTANTIAGNMRRLHPTLGREAIHTACARFAFRNREAHRVVGTLSGGERLRAGLACALSGPRPPWLLILDEPTNHLDIDAIAVLEAALDSFDGALLVVSHDRRFLDALGIHRYLDIEAERSSNR